MNHNHWDHFTIPDGVTPGEAHEWVFRNMPPPEEHDYTLYTDGSGHSDGLGAYAAIGYHRASTESVLRYGANYGMTVRRNELTALLEGLHAVISHHVRRMQELLDFNKTNPMLSMRGSRRISVAWITDRSDIACTLLYRENGEPLMRKGGDIDLWARLTALYPAVCLTPMHRSRNTVTMQGKCDSLCGQMRNLLKDNLEQSKIIIPDFIYPWTPLPQDALL